MNESQYGLGTRRWVCCYWQENFDVLDQIPQRGGLAASGVLMLPPPVEDLAGEEGLWTALNDELGTMIDVAEDEDLTVDVLLLATGVVSGIATQIEADGPRLIKKHVGKQVSPGERPLVAELSSEELIRHLRTLASFLEDAGHRQKPVTISL